MTAFSFFFETPRKSNPFIVGFSGFKIDHVIFSQNQMGKWDISSFSNIKKWDISEKHVTCFSKEPRMEFIDFWAFRGKMQMQSHDKILPRMLFGAFSGIVFHIFPYFIFLANVLSHNV